MVKKKEKVEIKKTSVLDVVEKNIEKKYGRVLGYGAATLVLGYAAFKSMR